MRRENAKVTGKRRFTSEPKPCLVGTAASVVYALVAPTYCDMKYEIRRLHVTIEEDAMELWHLTDSEWDRLSGLLVGETLPNDRPGRKRLQNDRAAAEACLYRHYHSHSRTYRTFGWNQLPPELGVSASTANRRFREWTHSGAWGRFWSALLVLRAQLVSLADDSAAWGVDREPGRFPAGDVLTELERAYAFFNTRFFGQLLPARVALILEHVRTGSCLGYFCARSWRDGDDELGQISLHTTVLGRGAGFALAVLLHEMVHLRNAASGLSDCHPESQYHNRHFRDLAVLSGLDCSQRDRRLGYAATNLNEQGRRACAEFQPNEPLFLWEVH